MALSICDHVLFFSQTNQSRAVVSELKDRIGAIEADLKNSEDLLSEKLSALDQLQTDYR